LSLHVALPFAQLSVHRTRAPVLCYRRQQTRLAKLHLAMERGSTGPARQGRVPTLAHLAGPRAQAQTCAPARRHTRAGTPPFGLQPSDPPWPKSESCSALARTRLTTPGTGPSAVPRVTLPDDRSLTYTDV